MSNFKFTFETDNEYMAARSTGYIDTFDVVRVRIKYNDGYDVDFPIYSHEELNRVINNADQNGNKILEMQIQPYIIMM